MQSQEPKCPSCGCTNMIFGGHHGMEHNVCESCGTVVECDQFTVDVFQKGSTEVAAEYDGKPANYGFPTYNTSNRKSRYFRDALEALKGLMDGLNLPKSVRNSAKEYFGYSNHLNKIASVGAAVYLAMKDFNMPVTIRCIANYLQISHYTIGRIMRKLEKRLGNRRTGSTAFKVYELIPHLFSQAKFGVEEENKRMLDLMLKKTDKLLRLLQECLATTGYEPHLIALAAGYIVWKHLNIHKWSELNMEIEKLPGRPIHCLTVALFLSEMGIKLSTVGQLISKINLIKDLLCKLAEQIPWLSINQPSEKSVIFHLNDFFKYKSQIIDMTAQKMSEDGKVDINKETPELKKEKEDVNDTLNDSEDSLLTSDRLVIDTSNQPDGDGLPSLTEDCSESVPDSTCAQDNFDKGSNKLEVSKIRFTRVTNLNIFPEKYPEMKCESPNAERKNGETESNGYNKLLKITHPNVGKTNNKRKRHYFVKENPCLLFP